MLNTTKKGSILMSQFCGLTGKKYSLGNKIGTGGEGSVYEVLGPMSRFSTS